MRLFKAEKTEADKHLGTLAMRRLPVLIALIFFGALSTEAQPSKRNDVVGPVKQMRLEIAKLTTVNGQSVEGPRTLIEIRTFDDKGKVISQIMNKRDGTLKWKLSWKPYYDAQGREMQREFYNAGGRLTSRVVFAYNEGTLVQATYYGANGLPNHSESFFYDSNGRKTRVDYRNPDGYLTSKTVYTYDARGNLKDETYYKPDGSVSQRNTLEHDERGNETGWSACNEQGVRGIQFTFAFSDDSKGNPVEVRSIGSDDGLLYKELYSYEFDAHGNWIKSQTIREVPRNG